MTSYNLASYAFVEGTAVGGDHDGDQVLLIVELPSPGSRGGEAPLLGHHPGHTRSCGSPTFGYRRRTWSAASMGRRAFAYEWFGFERIMVAGAAPGRGRRLLAEGDGVAAAPDRRCTPRSPTSSSRRCSPTWRPSCSPPGDGLRGLGAVGRRWHRPQDPARARVDGEVVRLRDGRAGRGPGDQIWRPRLHAETRPSGSTRELLGVERIWEGASEVQLVIIGGELHRRAAGPPCLIRSSATIRPFGRGRNGRKRRTRRGIGDAAEPIASIRDSRRARRRRRVSDPRCRRRGRARRRRRRTRVVDRAAEEPRSRRLRHQRGVAAGQAGRPAAARGRRDHRGPAARSAADRDVSTSPGPASSTSGSPTPRRASLPARSSPGGDGYGRSDALAEGADQPRVRLGEPDRPGAPRRAPAGPRSATRWRGSCARPAPTSTREYYFNDAGVADRPVRRVAARRGARASRCRRTGTPATTSSDIAATIVAAHPDLLDVAGGRRRSSLRAATASR